MATQPEFIDDADDQEIEQDLDGDDQDQGDEGTDDDDGQPADADQPEGDDDDDLITFGGVEARGETETEGMRNLRNRLKEIEAENRKLKGAPVIEDIGPEPDIDDYWDKPDQFKTDLLAWSEKKRTADVRQTEQQRQNEAIQKEYLDDVAEFGRQREGLKVRDFDASYDKVTATLNEAQVAILTQVARNKAPLMYALGKNPDKLEAIAKISNMAKFAGEVGRLDMETTVTKRKPTTQPETAHRGAGGGGRTDARLEKLEADARRTGNRTALIAYKAEKGIL